MRLVLHLGRAALIFWVAAVLLPSAVAQVGAVPQPASPETALLGVSSSADTGLAQLGGLTAATDGAESDIRRVVSRAQLEVERFIAKLP